MAFFLVKAPPSPMMNNMAERAEKCGDYLGFMCSSWSAPVWMKNNNSFKGRGRLRGNPGDEYHKTWARYLIKFLDVYCEKGVEFDYMTIQNEPTNGYRVFLCKCFYVNVTKIR